MSHLLVRVTSGDPCPRDATGGREKMRRPRASRQHACRCCHVLTNCVSPSPWCGMTQRSRSPGSALRSAWSRLSPLPGGRWLFGRLLSRMVPYTGTIRPRFLEIAPGVARVAMRDRRAVRNHLQSVHAIALANLAEVARRGAMDVALRDNVGGRPSR